MKAFRRKGNATLFALLSVAWFGALLWAASNGEVIPSIIVAFTGLGIAAWGMSLDEDTQHRHDWKD